PSSRVTRTIGSRMVGPCSASRALRPALRGRWPSSTPHSIVVMRGLSIQSILWWNWGTPLLFTDFISGGSIQQPHQIRAECTGQTGGAFSQQFFINVDPESGFIRHEQKAVFVTQRLFDDITSVQFWPGVI